MRAAYAFAVRVLAMPVTAAFRVLDVLDTAFRVLIVPSAVAFCRGSWCLVHLRDILQHMSSQADAYALIAT